MAAVLLGSPLVGLARFSAFADGLRHNVYVQVGLVMLMAWRRKTQF
jgi:hypothetical protein